MFKNFINILSVIVAILAAMSTYFIYDITKVQHKLVTSGTQFEAYIDLVWTLKILQISGNRFIIRKIKVTGFDINDNTYKTREIDMLPYLRIDGITTFYEVKTFNEIYCRLAGCRTTNLSSISILYKVYDQTREGLLFPRNDAMDSQ